MHTGCISKWETSKIRKEEKKNFEQISNELQQLFVSFFRNIKYCVILKHFSFYLIRNSHFSRVFFPPFCCLTLVHFSSLILNYGNCFLPIQLHHWPIRFCRLFLFFISPNFRFKFKTDFSKCIDIWFMPNALLSFDYIYEFRWNKSDNQWFYQCWTVCFSLLFTSKSHLISMIAIIFNFRFLSTSSNRKRDFCLEKKK